MLVQDVPVRDDPRVRHDAEPLRPQALVDGVGDALGRRLAEETRPRAAADHRRAPFEREPERLPEKGSGDDVREERRRTPGEEDHADSLELLDERGVGGVGGGLELHDAGGTPIRW